MNILEELYYGNITPQEKAFRRESDYAGFVKTVSENEEKLTAFLRAIPNAAEEQRLFSQLMSAQGEVNDIEGKERFIEGWKLGARVVLDTFIMPRYSSVTGFFEE